MDRGDYVVAAFSVILVSLMVIKDVIIALKAGGFVIAAFYSAFAIYSTWLAWKLAGKAWRNEV